MSLCFYTVCFNQKTSQVSPLRQNQGFQTAMAAMEKMCGVLGKDGENIKQ